jgi:hypothetical protein
MIAESSLSLTLCWGYALSELSFSRSFLRINN